MQTSFMHPPFGFALFYLRSVAPAKEYVDKVTKKTMAPITTGQIYWGAVPYVVIQVIMVGLVILFPQMVMVYKKDHSQVDPTKIEINVPGIDYGSAPPPNVNPGMPVPDSAPAASDEGKSLEDALGAPPSEEDANKALQDALGAPPGGEDASKAK